MLVPLSLLLSLSSLSTPVSLQHTPVSLKHTPYGSKARYHHVAGNISDTVFQCEPVSLFSVHRHGSRNIGTKTVKKIDFLVRGLTNYYKANQGPPAGLEWILQFSHSHKNNKDLVVEGYEELYDQGKRFGKHFSHLFNDDMKSNKFASSFKSRCVNSGLSFLYGVYGNHYHMDNASEILKSNHGKEECGNLCGVFNPLEKTNINEPRLIFEPKQNHLLRYHAECKNYVIKESEKLVWQQEPNKYLKRTHMLKLTERVSKRLKITVSAYDVVTLHIMCVIEIGFPRLMHNSHWCDLFENEELYITAYYLDLMRYAGKMMPEVVKASCVLWQDGLQFLNSTRGVNIKFAHTETLFPLLEHVGYLTEPMLPGVGLLDRQFFGDLTPLGSNLVVVAMKCEDSDELKVRVLLNEKPIELPGCGYSCSLDTLLQLFPQERCNFVEICEGEWSNTELAFVGLLAICMVDMVRRLMFK